MSRLRRHLSGLVLSDLVIPSNLKYGTMINKRGGVEIIEERATKVEAWAGGLTGSVAEGGGSKRRVQIWLAGSKLYWHCAGNPKNHDIFCKHCVAVTLFLRKKA